MAGTLRVKALPDPWRNAAGDQLQLAVEPTWRRCQSGATQSGNRGTGKTLTVRNREEEAGSMESWLTEILRDAAALVGA